MCGNKIVPVIQTETADLIMIWLQISILGAASNCTAGRHNMLAPIFTGHFPY